MGIAAPEFFSANDAEKQTLSRRIAPTSEQMEDQQERWDALAVHLRADLSERADSRSRPGPVEIAQVAGQLGIEFRLANTVANYLVEKGLLRRLKMGMARLTANGVDEIEDALAHPDIGLGIVGADDCGLDRTQSFRCRPMRMRYPPLRLGHTGCRHTGANCCCSWGSSSSPACPSDCPTSTRRTTA